MNANEMKEEKVERRVRTTPRKGDGGVYLVIVDEAPEFEIALRYAARCAESRRGYVALLNVYDLNDFQDWGGVEQRLMRELRLDAEEKTKRAAEKVHELTARPCAMYICEGNKNSKIVDVINQDDSLVCLVLGGGVGGDSGPLITHFVGKALGKLRVPVIVVPGNLDLKRIDAIT